jgi:hypothetical protein
VVPASKKALQLRQDELKTQMVAAQAANWREACPRGALLLNASLIAQEPWRQKLIAAVFDDFEPFDRKPSG